MRQIFLGGTYCVLVTVLCACSTETPESRSGDKPPPKTETETADAEVRTENAADVIVPSGTNDWSRVTFRFAGPDVDSDHEAGEITFKIDTGTFAVGKYGLYYNQTHHSLDAAEPIAEDLDPTVKEVTWDTSDLDNGTYFVFAVLEYEESVNVRFFPGSLNIVDNLDGNRLPFVQILNNFRGDGGGISTFQPGEAIDLNLVAVDPDQEEMELELLFSQDDGVTWESLGNVTDQLEAQGNPDLGRFTLPINLPNTEGETRLRLEATDEYGNTSEATSKAFFIGTPPVDEEV